MQFTRPTEISFPLMLPLFSERAPCGFPSPTQDYVEDRLDLNKLLIKHPNVTYFIKASGELMRDTGISDRDLLVVDRLLFAVHGDIVIAAIVGEFTVKELRTHPSLQLVPHNCDYASISLHNAEELGIPGVATFSIEAHKQLCLPSSMSITSILLVKRLFALI